MDIVIPYKSETSWRQQELIFSLRSIEKYVKGYNDIYIVSDSLPGYLNNNIKFIKYENPYPANKEKDIKEKLILACKEESVSNPFLLWNDDYFVLKNIFPEMIAYYYFDSLENKLKRRKAKDIYWQALKNTYEILKIEGRETKHFDIHYPMKIRKKIFIETMENYEWDVRGGYVIKSLYANSINIRGTEKKDCKIYFSQSKREIREIIKNTNLFSTDKISREMAEILQELYPERSKYEK